MKKNPPGPLGHYLFGSLRDLQHDPLGLFMNSHKQWGDIVRFRFGPSYCYLLIHPEYIKQAFQDHSENYCKKTRGYKYLQLGVQDGIFTSEGEVWKKQRQLAQTAFRSEQVAKMIPKMAEAIQPIVHRWESLTKNQNTIDLHSEMSHLTLTIVDRTLFRMNWQKEINTIADAMKFIDHFLAKRTRRLFNVPLCFPINENRSFLKNIKSLHGIAQDVIEKYRNTSGEEEGLITMIASGHGLNGQKSHREKSLREQILTFMVIGHETTAIALTWTFYLIAQHPHVEKKIHAELDTLPGDKTPSYEDLLKLKYTEQVLKESLRLFPPAWQLARSSIQEDEIGSYRIAPRTTVVISPYVTHRHPDFWGDPEVFRPERFDPSQEKNIHPFAYLPFGIGPRKCTGQHFALLESKLAISLLLSKFKLKLYPHCHVTANPLLSLPPRDPITMIISPR